MWGSIGQFLGQMSGKFPKMSGTLSGTFWFFWPVFDSFRTGPETSRGPQSCAPCGCEDPVISPLQLGRQTIDLGTHRSLLSRTVGIGLNR